MQFNPNTIRNAPTRTGKGRNTVPALQIAITLGRNISDPLPGSPTKVTPEALQAFLDRSVTPRFPDGYSVSNGQGVWKGDREDTVTISVVVPITSRADAGVKIEEIRSAYALRFNQETTLRTDTTCMVSIA